VDASKNWKNWQQIGKHIGKRSIVNKSISMPTFETKDGNKEEGGVVKQKDF